jgi:hypothetical protein
MRTDKRLPQRGIAATVGLVVAVLGLGVAAASGAAPGGRERAGAPPARKASAGHCGSTWIVALTENRTATTMRVTQTGNGPSTRWCPEPSDFVKRGSTDQWGAGDDEGDVRVDVGYQLSNGDRLLFFASVKRGGATSVGCRFTENLPTPRDYECEGEVTVAGSGIAFVKFILRSRAR